MTDREKVLEDLEYAVRKSHANGWDYVDGLTKVGEVGMSDRVDIPGTETVKIKRQIPMTAIRCLACGKWECPEFNHELYDAVVTGETYGICDACRKAIEWAKERMKDR